ncbi:uncharacterized protein C17orf50 homolog [Hyla sarda]|uniref:uncharacterized protein C17orf50 homolog n=1 Tax=Hyla sarda TaxID=327740 RepID=UPI0024C3DB8F|nr:uncharacterized protein C17orf50 homolog [Hyla sarda]
MSCVRPPEMSRLEEVESDEEGPGPGDVLSCGGCLWSCFTPKETPPAESVTTLEEQTVAGSPSDHSEAAGPGLERRPSLLEGLVGVIRASLSWTTSLRRKPQVEGRRLICCLLEPMTVPEPCPVCPILLCPACDTLHCHPNYIYHCLLEHPSPPGPDALRPVSPFTLSDLSLHEPNLLVPGSSLTSDPGRAMNP